ncbi:hypothetical protein [Steroidobacter cummioxidans]|uniref:hypothetical protein n=1 Tax=Steroidobacter cummioxidans TaxID=1803913 RepID=UPI0019D4DFA9|nr:hypothetical protein [Steroidobacter cummioxidans]
MMNRRDVMIAMAMAGAAAASQSVLAGAKDISASEHDWDWLIGNWDVWHRRLKERLAGNDDWQEFNGKSVFWTTLNGLGNLDDNVVELPDGIYRGLSIRSFDPATRQWAIWWLDGRYPTRLDPPVLGRIEADSGTFVGQDTFKGRPITVRFRWLDIHSKRPNWEQAFSPDGGKTWEVNWRNYFTRTNARPTSLPRLDDAPRDWDFLAGTWQVRNRRLKRDNQWEGFDNTLTNWSVLGGFGNVDSETFNAPGGVYRGVSLRAYDRDTKQWLRWWMDGRNPSQITMSERGSFKDGVGTFIGDDTLNGKPLKVRSQWSRITPSSARWEQASSADNGATWQTTWLAELTRKA